MKKSKNRVERISEIFFIILVRANIRSFLRVKVKHEKVLIPRSSYWGKLIVVVAMERTAASLQRKTFVDTAKGLTILLVVMEHNPYIYKYNIVAQTIILSFHMPLFYFVSGLFFSTKDSFQRLFVKRFHSLVKPYLTACLLFVLLKSFKNGSVREATTLGLGIFCGTGKSLSWPYQQLWFLTSLFVTVLGCRILYAYLSKIDSRIARLSILFVLLLIGIFFARLGGHFFQGGLPWNIDLFGITLFFYALGYEWRTWLFNMERLPALQILLVLLMFLLLHFFFTIRTGNPCVLNLVYREYDSVLVNTVEAISGILLVVLLSVMLVGRLPAVAAFFSFVGQKSLAVFIFHELIMPYVSKIGLFFLAPDGISLFIVSVSITVAIAILVHELFWRMPVVGPCLLNRKPFRRIAQTARFANGN